MRHRARATAALFFSVFVITAGLAANGRTQPFPSKGTYQIYILGKHAGTSGFTSEIDENILLLHSRTTVNYEEYHLEIESTTKLDKETLLPISFTYKGIKPPGKSCSGSIVIRSDTAFGEFKEDTLEYSSKKIIQPNNTTIFENYVAAHEVVLARTFLASGQDFKTIYLFYPSDFSMVRSLASLESEIQMDVAKGPIICTKMGIAISGGMPFYSYIDMKREIPVYLDFPGANTEFFLQDYYGDKAQPKYGTGEKQEH